MFAHLHAIPRRQVLAALGFTARELLAAHHLRGAGARATCRRAIPYTRILFTSFIAYSFGHTLGFAAFTGAAIRFRLYATAGVSAIDVATVTAFCSLSLGIGLATVSGLSLLLSPAHAASVLQLHHNWSLLRRRSCCSRRWPPTRCGRASRARAFEIRGWALRAPGPAIGLTQIVLVGARPVAVRGGAVVAAAARRRTSASSPSSACTPPR